MPAATWVKGKKRIKGNWTYVRSRNRFIINIFKRCPISGQGIEFEVSGDEPEFNGWKLETSQSNGEANANIPTV